MQTAGFVLAGGSSTRMGRDKALIEINGRRMIESVASAVLKATGSVTIIGPPETYSQLGYPVHPDLREGCGPLAGIETALTHTDADWNLILACDMPQIDADLLKTILAEAEAYPEVGCVLPESEIGFVQPLCGAYHKRGLAAISRALDDGTRRITGSLHGLEVHYIRIAARFQNINTPEDLKEYMEYIDERL